MGVFRTIHAFSIFDIENRSLFGTNNTLFASEERFIKGTIGDIVVLYASLIVLFDEIVDGETA